MDPPTCATHSRSQGSPGVPFVLAALKPAGQGHWAPLCSAGAFVHTAAHSQKACPGHGSCRKC